MRGANVLNSGVDCTGLRSSRLDIVDLAGASPEEEEAHAEGDALSDLRALRRVVSQLAARTPKRRVDYAASPLTYLLRDALGGNRYGKPMHPCVVHTRLMHPCVVHTPDASMCRTHA
jgi:hypothetical protein